MRDNMRSTSWDLPSIPKSTAPRITPTERAVDPSCPIPTISSTFMIASERSLTTKNSLRIFLIFFSQSCSDGKDLEEASDDDDAAAGGVLGVFSSSGNDGMEAMLGRVVARRNGLVGRESGDFGKKFGLLLPPRCCGEGGGKKSPRFKLPNDCDRFGTVTKPSLSMTSFSRNEPDRLRERVANEERLERASSCAASRLISDNVLAVSSTRRLTQPFCFNSIKSCNMNLVRLLTGGSVRSSLVVVPFPAMVATVSQQDCN
mmetsp:Transcript_1713/g.2367  ORF Transcript_1713/g.2367 Transcript_1713/m.2367 type:complete len:259 (-) Transcript_1713:893-1669(-)